MSTHSPKLLISLFVVLLPVLPAADETRSLLRARDIVSPAVLEQAAAKALRTPLTTIVDKARPSPTGDAHDYISYARYWWPDPAKPDGLPQGFMDDLRAQAARLEALPPLR